MWHLLSLEDGLTDTPAEGDNFVLALGKRSEDRFGRLPLYRFRKTRSGYLAGVRFPNGAKGASGRGRSKCEAKQEAARRSLVLLPPLEEPFFSAE